MKINKRWALILLVSAGQLALLLFGVSWFAGRLDASLADLMRKEVLANNEQMATQMAMMIEEMDLTHLDYGSPDWTRLQMVIEKVRLPNDGFLCVINGTGGNLICHPDLRHEPKMRDMKPGLATLRGPGLGRAIVDSTNDQRGSVGGRATMPDGTHLIGIRDLPSLGVKVMAHQREAGIVKATAAVVMLVRRVGFGTAVVMVMLGFVLTAAIVQRYENRLAHINTNLEQLVRRRSESLIKTRDAVIFGLAKLAESRDDDTGEHLERIRTYVEILARQLGKSHRDIDDEAIRMLGLTSSLHDIGKVGVPDAVLLKPGRLSPKEREIIETHTTIGGDCLLAIKQRLGDDDFLEIACEIAFSHHERWDGDGYPFRLSGEQIPLPGRIAALADVYDALTSKRVYKDAMSHEKARRIILDGASKHFDPQIVEAFVACEAEFQAVAAASRQGEAPRAPRPLPEPAIGAV